MDIGIALPHLGPYASPEAIVRVAQEAERLNYASVWVSERLLRPVGLDGIVGGRPSQTAAAYATVYEPIETLTYVAAKTERIRLGTSVINAVYYEPIVVAKRLATLDRFSGGRLIAGLGQGWMAEEFVATNVPVKRRGSGLEEFVAALRAAWGPDPVHYQGRFYTIPESEVGPKPVQAGGPPILIGGSNPAAIDRAARIGDGYNPMASTWEALEQNVGRFRAAAEAAGRNPEALPIVARANHRISATPLEGPRPPVSGSPEQLADDFDRLERMGISHAFFDPGLTDMPIDDVLRFMQRLRAAAGE